jgi:hypothetical protein
MRRFLPLGSLLAIPALALLLATVPGCPSKDSGTKDKAVAGKDGKPSGDGEKEKGGKGGKGEALAVKSTDASVKGRVVYDGTPPKMKPITAIDTHGDKAQCHAGPEFTQVEQTWMVGKDNGVANTVVYLEPTDGKFFALDAAEADKLKGDATIDQPYCAFEPHVTALFAAYKDKDGAQHDTGAKLHIKNSGKISHNSKSPGDGKKNDFNASISGGEEKSYALKFQKQPLDIACDKHNWMSAKVKLFDHPFFAVTDKDGNFEIKHAPTGEFKITIWHEQGSPDSKTMELKSGANDAGTLKTKAAS